MPEFSGMTQSRPNQKLNAYLKNQIYSMSPMQLLMKVYDVAILGCKTKDSEKVGKALVELIAGLKFEYEEISVGLFRLYQYCLDETKKGRFDIPLEILLSLRETWLEAAKRQVPENTEEAKVG